MRMEHLTMPEFRQGLRRTRTVIVPLGSTEQHGPHLPLDTDTLLALTAAELAAERIPVFVAPPLHYGICTSTRDHPGTVSVSPETFRCLLRDVIRSLHQQGLRRVILLSGHAGGLQLSAMREVGEALLLELRDLRMAVLSAYALMREADAGIETPGDSHAGEMETSCLLYLHPDLVKGTARAEYPRFPRDMLVRDKRRYWKGGVWGDPSKATPQKGKALMEAMVARLVAVVRELEGRHSVQRQGRTRGL